MMKRFIFSAAIALLTSHAATAQPHHHHAHHTASSPIGVMGDHVHPAGEWMTSYRYGRMSMRGNRSGSSDVSTAAVLSGFMVAPTNMTMEMHMAGLMYGVTDAVTAMVMLPYLRTSMDHVTRMGGHFSTRTEGLSDIRLSGLFSFYERGNHTLHASAGLGLPTGSIDEKGTTPMGYTQLPYPMQLGSGTFDLLPGITYRGGDGGNWSWGGQLGATLRLGENNNDYRLGHAYTATAWGMRRVSDILSLSARLDARRWGDVHGADPALSPMVVPTARADLRGGRRLDGLLGLNLHLPQWHGHEFAIEVGAPLYQHLDGPQPETDWRLTAGWQWRF